MHLLVCDDCKWLVHRLAFRADYIPVGRHTLTRDPETDEEGVVDFLARLDRFDEWRKSRVKMVLLRNASVSCPLRDYLPIARSMSPPILAFAMLETWWAHYSAALIARAACSRRDGDS